MESLRKGELSSSTLRRAWYHLRVSVRHPERVPSWDAIILSCASPEQAELYNWQLKRAKRFGRISSSTLTLAVPDPNGQRIGSGAATLNAIRTLSTHYHSLNTNSKEANVGDCDSGIPEPSEMMNEQVSAQELVDLVVKRHILLLHAGGDSKRVPWANPMGKVFLPLPYLAADDPDGPVPLLFDHILAIASCARQAFRNEGGLFIMTGDVLPCFDAFNMVLPEDAASIITVPITLDIASNHGVVVASKSKILDGKSSVTLVENLLQKPSLKELTKHQAILDDGRTLLDTGIIAVKGKAWVDLAMLACYSEPAISELVKTKTEMSLYEELVAAWVDQRHDWLLRRPMGEELVSSLGKQKMFSYCAYDLLFLHFGTSSEVLDHLSETGSGLIGRRHLSSSPATTVSDIAASSVILSSKIAPGVSIGEGSLVYDSSIPSGMQLGSLSIVVGLNVPETGNKAAENQFRFMLPDRHCLWEVPLVEQRATVLAFCGLHDNPKDSLSQDGTFCGKPWRKVLNDLCIQDTDLWSSKQPHESCLWNAKIYPILPYFKMLQLATWLMGLSNDGNESLHDLWQSSERISLEELHRSIDYKQMCSGSSNHQADLAAGIVKASLEYGLLGHNIFQLSEEVLQKEATGIDICKEFLAQCPNLQVQQSQILPKSRAHQVHLDLLRACGDEDMACLVEHKVWDAVADETASAVRYGFEDSILKSSSWPSTTETQGNHTSECTDHTYHFKTVKVELPVRVDFVGGWSDTPPWSLERAGCVLNMAITLEGSLPIGAIIETNITSGILIKDNEHELHIVDLSSITPPFDHDDPFRLVKCALLVTNAIKNKILLCMGLSITTWANVPRGSGLGTSSILAAAVVKGLLQIIDEDDSDEKVARLVLVLEQLMGTGGGWQDQIGGLYPGIKFTTSFPGIPLRLKVLPLLASSQLVRELQDRLLVVFTGQVRLARQVLQKVVTRYLQRDNILISSIKRLIELAKIGREALMNSDVDELGHIMLEAWRLHQELDPYCSNEFVDRLFDLADPHCCGYKLVGAGGGGFALLLTKSSESTKELKSLLTQHVDHDVKRVVDTNPLNEDLTVRQYDKLCAESSSFELTQA